jgi:hypothetical protein
MITPQTAAAGPTLQPAPLAPDEMALLRAVLYASLFDCPLTLTETLETLVGSIDTEAGLLAMYHSSPTLQTLIEHRDGLFFVRGADRLVLERQRRERATRALLDANRPLLTAICAVPFTALVALSGKAARFNLVQPGGALDLFVVTRGRRVWSVTLAIALLTRLFRRRSALRVSFVLADTALALDAADQDLCTANEIVHLRPLAGGSVYCRFVDANAFVERWYPNFEAKAAALDGFAASRRAAAVKRALESLLGWGPSALLERVSRAVYLRHLRRQSPAPPTEIRLTAECLNLQPRDARQSVLCCFDRSVNEALNRL